MDTIKEVKGVLLYQIVLYGYNKGSARGATVPVPVTQQLIVNDIDKLCSHSISLVSVYNVLLFRSFVAKCLGIFSY